MQLWNILVSYIFSNNFLKRIIFVANFFRKVKQQILKYLNETGKYDSFKEELKQTVIRIVREKFANSIKYGGV